MTKKVTKKPVAKSTAGKKVKTTKPVPKLGQKSRSGNVAAKKVATSKKATTPKKAVAPKKATTEKKKPYVNYATILKNVGGGLSTPCESKTARVGKYSVHVERSPYLDRYGNPVHTATVRAQNGLHASCTSNGTLANTVSGALKKIGVKTRYAKPKKK